jgi:DEAD/DEAH box helicase
MSSPLIDFNQVQAIILAPSRELVTQIGLVGESVFKGSGINILSLIGGANVRNQIKRLRDQKPQIIVATPGRLAELVFQLRKLKLGMVRALVIDEVDSMLKEPFIGELLTIIEATAMFKKDFTGDDVSSRKPKTQGSDGAFGYMGGDVDDNDERYNDDDGDIDIDSMGDDEEVDGDGDEEEVEEEGEGEGDEEVAPHLNKRLVCLASATVNDPAVKVTNALTALNDNSDDQTLTAIFPFLFSVMIFPLLSFSQ